MKMKTRKPAFTSRMIYPSPKIDLNDIKNSN